MIQIDDTGSGSLIGGTGIGIYNTENRQYVFKVIPVKYFQNMKYYTQKLFQDQAVLIIKKIFADWQIAISDTEIQVCSSYVFNKLRIWLEENKYQWTSIKIEGPLQHLVEKSFFDYLISLGLPENYLKHTRYAYGFHRLLHWIYADRTNREKICKTCWQSFRRWGYFSYEAKIITIDHEIICLKCGKMIVKGSKCKHLDYPGKYNEKLFIHANC